MIYETIPEEYNINDKSYVYAICRCPIPLDKCIKIPIKYIKNNEARFKCRNCGLEGSVILGGFYE